MPRTPSDARGDRLQALSGPTRRGNSCGAIDRIGWRVFGSVRRVATSLELDEPTEAEKSSQIWPSVSNETVPSSPARSWRASNEILAVDAAWITRRSCGDSLGLHQHYRECDEHGAARLPQREAMARPRWRCAGPLPLCRKRRKGFRRLKAHKQLPALRAAREAHQNRNSTTASLLAKPTPLNINLWSATASQCSTKCGTSAGRARFLVSTTKPRRSPS